MPSAASTRLRVELQAIGENLNSWGDTRLNEALKRLEEGIAKVLSVTVAGSNVTLTSSNYIEDEARSAVLVLTGTPGATRQIIIPLVQKVYLVVNNTNADQTIGGATGALATIRQGKTGLVYCNATDTFTYDPRISDLRAPNANVAFGSNRLTGVADPVDNQDAATKAWVVATYASAVAAAEAARDAALVAETNAETAETNAETAETNAEAAAADAALQAAKLTGTSTTSNSIGTGSKSFTTQAGKLFDVGARLLITSDAAPASRSMFGTVTAYSGTSLTVDVAATVGSGTYTDWTIRVSGERGAQGTAGSVEITRNDQSGSYTVLSTDQGKVIRCTGTFTVELPDASSLPDGFTTYIANVSTGVITIDPASSETIDGGSSVRVYPGQTRLVQGNATDYVTVLTASPARILLGSSTVGAAVASVAFTSLNTSDFTAIEIEFEALSTASGTRIALNMTPDGSTWRTRAQGGGYYRDPGSLLLGGYDDAFLVSDSAGAEVYNGKAVVKNMGTTRKTFVSAIASINQTSRITFSAIEYSQAEIHTGFRLIADAGNIDAGDVRVYGVI